MSLLKRILLFLESKLIILVFLLNRVKIKDDLKCKGIPYIRNRGLFKLESGVRLNSRISANPIGGNQRCYFVIRENALLHIGSRVAISNTAITCASSIEISDDVMIGGNTKIYDTDFHSLIFEERTSSSMDVGVSKPIRIERGVFIGAHCIVLKGVTIGEFSVIGSGSVVTKNIPANEIWAGNPAKFIRRIL